MNKIKYLFYLSLFFTGFNTISAQTYHTITVDANLSEWNIASELYVAAGGINTNWYLTWDANNFYIAVERVFSDLLGDTDALTIFFDNDANLTPSNGTGSTTGNVYQGVTATLPFTANYVARVERNYTQSNRWTGTAWSSNISPNNITQVNNGDTRTIREISIPWTEIGNGTKPSQIYLTAFISYSTGVYAGVPAGNESQTSSGGTKNFSNYFGGYETVSGVNPNGTTDTPLPVELTSFTASTQGSTVTLNWKTATELNNYGFEIERNSNSFDDTWNKIGFVEGNGNSNSLKSYSFIDDAVGFNKVFYRLKQIDNNGQFEYSNVVEVDLNIPEKFVLEQNYPNPFNPSTTIRFAFEENTFAALKIYNAVGEEVAEIFNGIADAGRVYSVNFDASKLTSGIYLYKLSSGKNIAVKKMLLLK